MAMREVGSLVCRQGLNSDKEAVFQLEGASIGDELSGGHLSPYIKLVATLTADLYSPHTGAVWRNASASASSTTNTCTFDVPAHAAFWH